MSIPKDKLERVSMIAESLASIIAAVWRAIREGDERKVDEILGSELASTAELTRARLDALERFKVQK